ALGRHFHSGPPPEWKRRPSAPRHPPPATHTKRTGSKGRCPWRGSKGQRPLVGVWGRSPGLASFRTAACACFSGDLPVAMVHARFARGAAEAGAYARRPEPQRIAKMKFKADRATLL